MDIELIGGKSGRRKVTFVSNQYVATARSDRNNDISSEVKPLPPLSGFLFKYDRLPWPRLLRIFLFLISDLKLRGKILTCLGTTVFIFLLAKLPKIVLASEQHHWLLIILWVLLIMEWLGILAFIITTVKWIAPWHGAEHMAADAYNRLQSTALNDIARASRINEKCGSRLVFPFFVGFALAITSSYYLEINYLLAFAAIAEIVLWVDKLKGWNNIPTTAQLSYWLQKYITTRQPGNQELLTAQKAIETLIAAHSVKAQ